MSDSLNLFLSSQGKMARKIRGGGPNILDLLITSARVDTVS